MKRILFGPALGARRMRHYDRSGSTHRQRHLYGHRIRRVWPFQQERIGRGRDQSESVLREQRPNCDYRLKRKSRHPRLDADQSDRPIFVHVMIWAFIGLYIAFVIFRVIRKRQKTKAFIRNAWKPGAGLEM